MNNKYDFPNNWNERQYFLHACFVDNLKLFYKQWIEHSPNRAQYFLSVPLLIHKYWQPSNICRVSGEILTPNNIDIFHSYWTSGWYPVRKDLKRSGELEEAYECQKIDKSCNDCKYFNRKDYWCTKLDALPKGSAPNFCYNHECFTHRKD